MDWSQASRVQITSFVHWSARKHRPAPPKYASIAADPWGEEPKSHDKKESIFLSLLDSSSSCWGRQKYKKNKKGVNS